jgi:hypothetical protein
MPNKELKILNKECYYSIIVGDIKRESAFCIKRRERSLL